MNLYFLKAASIPAKRERWYTISFLLAIGLILSVTLISIRPAIAQGVGGFGGRILYTQECGCSGGWMIAIGPPTPGLYVFQFGVSQLFSFGQIFRPGPAVLGVAVPGGVCIPASTVCLAAIPAQTIITVGTSL